jgi:hypothetical protein
MVIAAHSDSTVRRQYVCGSFRRIAWKNNVFLRAKLARYGIVSGPNLLS